MIGMDSPVGFKHTLNLSSRNYKNFSLTTLYVGTKFNMIGTIYWNDRYVFEFRSCTLAGRLERELLDMQEGTVEGVPLNPLQCLRECKI